MPIGMKKNRGGSLDLHADSGQRALKEAGLLEKFQRLARPEGETLRIIAPDGEVLMDESRGDPGRPDEFANRPEIDRTQLTDLLLGSLPPEAVKWGCRLLKIQELENSKLNLVFADGHEEPDIDLVVGADGTWSKVRPFLSDTTPSYSGIGGLDCYIPSVDSRYPGLSEHVGQGMCLNLGSQKGIMCQRNSNGNIQLYAFGRLPIDWFSTCGIDFTHSTAREKIIAALFSEFTGVQKSLVLNSEPDTIGRQLFTLPPNFRWNHHPRITIIGDAAHLMTPFAGVGVNLAMQDALDLAHAVAGVGWDQRPMAPMDTRLKQFEEAMWARAKQNAEATLMYQGLFFHDDGGIAMVEHFAKRRQE
ncbi:FAD/NAD(P)-binding domain-containing protein [Apiospora kogelbergensis]|uniref:FAD/NAD(P)-binding domain-containing protein n=1 Tax=Apiospora kogelbergensis TaxID=1337665 RepID=UPI00312DCBBD